MAARCDACGTPDGNERSYRSSSADEKTTVLCPCCAAAPELADALEALVRFIHERGMQAAGLPDNWVRQLEKARAVLRKSGRML